mgnify:CR=1 FL=1
MKKRTQKWISRGGVALGLLMLICFLLSPWRIYQKGTDFIYLSVDQMDYREVGIVFGAGITTSGRPSDVLRDRLDIAYEAYVNGAIDKILVSGDNQTEDYSEPDVMRDYLIQQGVPEEDVVADYAGRRSYDTCARANEIWGIETALLITQGYHLPRAIYLCESMGIDSRGISSSQQDYIAGRYYEFREILAIYKAVLDVNLLKPDYIGGESEEL